MGIRNESLCVLGKLAEQLFRYLDFQERFFFFFFSGEIFMSPIYCITDSMDMNLNKLWEIVKDRGVWSAAVHGVAKNLEESATT